MLAVVPFMLVFRFLHIVAGILWVGSAFLFTAIIGPSAAEVGPSAGPLLAVAVKKRKVAKLISAFGMIAVTAGWVMWIKDWRDMGSLGSWVGSSFGLALTIGGVLATVAAYEGITKVGRNVERLVDLGGEVAASGGPPSPEQASRMASLQATIKKHGQIGLVLMLIAIATMATARSW